MSMIICIPARMRGTRLPGKPLFEAGGKTLLEWTYKSAKLVCGNVVVLTPDDEIVNLCQAKKIQVFRSGPAPNGTWRMADTVFTNNNYFRMFDRFVNWQVDEPLAIIRKVFVLLMKNCDIGTLVSDISAKDRDDPNLVKVVTSGTRCYWFSRKAISKVGHCGIYSISREALGWYWLNGNPPSFHAREESLEQLTWIEKSPFQVTPCFCTFSLSINTQQDWNEFKEIMESG